MGPKSPSQWLSTTQGVRFCPETLEEVLEIYGKRTIFNTDQGSRFMSKDWTERLKAEGIEVLMNGKGC